MAKEQAPVLVKILAILSYISAGSLAIAGIASLVAGGSVGSMFSSIPLLSLLGSAGAGLFVALAVILILFAVLNFFIGRGLWNGQGWARILIIVLAILGVLASLSSLTQVSGIILLIYDGAVAGYLLFSKDAKQFFKK